MQEQIQKYYEEFHGVGEPAIVRNNHVNDAFEVVVLKIMYERLLDIVFDKDHIEDLQKYINSIKSYDPS